MNQTNPLVETLEHELNTFDPAIRAIALKRLLDLVDSGQVTPAVPSMDVNMHCHTFHSFNAYGYSPNGLAWLARRQGYRAVGIVDFDVLDGVEEFLSSCELAGVRGSAGIETRVFIPEFADREINSPGEPGVCYHMGIGFISCEIPQEVTSIQADMRQRAIQRNLGMIGRLNAYLAPLSVDYEEDVLPLTPGGNATERHMLRAYIQGAHDAFEDVEGFWAGKLGLPKEKIAALLGDTAEFQNLVRSKLMKRGGAGYVQPGPDSFPTVEEFHKLIEACGALPCAAWLDGTSKGEQAEKELLDLLIGKGVVALNIIPDRNWNIADPEVRRRKIENLYQVVGLAQSLDLPLNVGTEMNSYGNKLIDDFDAIELQPVRQAFVDGAHFIFGHTMLQRGAGLGYQSEWAKRHLPTRRERNAFYTRLGYTLETGKIGLTQLSLLAWLQTPEQVLASFVKPG